MNPALRMFVVIFAWALAFILDGTFTVITYASGHWLLGSVFLAAFAGLGFAAEKAADLS